MHKTIWVFFGLIATGKSTLAAAFAERHSLPYYNSDRVRKELAGLVSTDRVAVSMQEGIYSREFTHRTYTELLKRAKVEVAAGRSVVLDASYQKRDERQRVMNLAAILDVRIVFVYCICSPDVVKNRLAQRMLDADAVSDGRWEIYEIQKERFEAPDELDNGILIKLFTDRSVDELLENLEASYEV